MILVTLERILLLAGDLALDCGVEAVGLSLRLAPCGSITMGSCRLVVYTWVVMEDSWMGLSITC